MEIGSHKILQEANVETMQKIMEVFPQLKIKKVRRIDQEYFIAESQNQVNGVMIMKLIRIKPYDLKRYKIYFMQPKHDYILLINAFQYFQMTNELIIITQKIDKKLKEYTFSKQDQLMQKLIMMHKITEGCLYLQNNYPHLLAAVEYDCIFLSDKIPKISILGFIKLDQRQKSQQINFRSTMKKIGILLLSLMSQQRIDTFMEQIQLEKEIKSIKNHDLMIMINEMIFNKNQTQTPTFDDILIYLTRIKYKTMDFKDITMNINQVYSHYQDSSRYLTDSLRLPFLNSYQEIIEKSVQQQNAMALFLLAKMYALNQQQNKLSQQSLQKIKNLYLSAYQKGEKFSAFQLYLGEQQFDQNGDRNEAKIMYLMEAIKRQDQRSYVQMKKLRFYGYYGVEKQPQKALKNLQDSKFKHINLYNNLLKIRISTNNYQQAQKYIAKCFAYGSNVEVRNCLFNFWYQKKKYLRAIECLKKYIKYLNQNQCNYIDKINQSYFYMGKIYQYEGNNIKAKLWYWKCLSTQNKHKLAALVGLSLVDDKNRVNYLNQAIMLENDSKNNLRIAYSDLGYCNSYHCNLAKQRQNIGKAIQYLQLAQSLGIATKSSMRKGQIILRQTHDLNNKNLAIQILYESNKYCNQKVRQNIQKIFDLAIKDEKN